MLIQGSKKCGNRDRYELAPTLLRPDATAEENDRRVRK